MQTTSTNAVRVAAALLAGSIATASLAQTTERTFTYQGVLLDSNGSVPSIPFVIFDLYRTEVGGTRIAREFPDNGFLNLDDVGGFTTEVDFGTQGGDGLPIYNGGDLYLEITVDNEVLSPRQRVTPTPIALSMPGAYALNSQLVLGESMNEVVVGDGLQNIGLDVLKGTITLNSANNLAALFESASPIGTWLTLDNVSAGGSRWALISTGSDNGEGPGSFVLSDQSVGAARMVIDDLGNVGFGVSDPTERLDVGGAIRIRGADIVEGFDSSCGGVIEPGTVVSIDPAPGHEGELMPSGEAYDTKVAGVVSGAGGIPYGMALAYDGQFGGDTKVAMTGRVYVKCSAEAGPIRAGDLLTSASLPGHAMKASDRSRAHGTVIGKAMSSLDDGTGLVLVLVNLQ